MWVKPDLDNMEKILVYLQEGAVFDNDKYIMQIGDASTCNDSAGGCDGCTIIKLACANDN
jgi:Holliday junction resolvase RusA-like endonuclease